MSSEKPREDFIPLTRVTVDEAVSAAAEFFNVTDQEIEALFKWIKKPSGPICDVEQHGPFLTISVTVSGVTGHFTIEKDEQGSIKEVEL